MGFELFKYPQQAIFGKVLPKSKIYEFAKPSNAVRELFIKQVEQIVWEYKLSPETINIPAGEGVDEIQILKIHSKVPEIDAEVFRTIDEAIPSHIFYEVVFANNTKLVAAYKRPNEIDSGKWVTGAYFESDWVPSVSARTPIPIALTIGGLYTQMLRSIMPGHPRGGESLKAQAHRLEQLRLKNGELAKLKIKLAKEKQFNKKVETNSELRIIQNLINQLID
ncbi:DUF4391 domain-containing protein [Polynucleobacter paneuropaeus]|nr:DUF4391 domain-containing protein [Polynucleobacter paneuropaeus]